MSITPEQLAKLEKLLIGKIPVDEIEVGADELEALIAAARELEQYKRIFPLKCAQEVTDHINKVDGDWLNTLACVADERDQQCGRADKAEQDRNQWKERAEKAEEIVKSFTKEAMSIIHKKPPAGMGPKMALHIPTGEIYNLAPPGCDFPDPPIDDAPTA